MELMDAIRKRRAIRKYKPEPVPQAMLTQLLEAARLAPSGVNAQPWKFKVVTDPAEREKLFKATKNQFHVGQAPAVIVVCADTMSYSKGLRERFKELYDKGVVSEDDLNRLGFAGILTGEEEQDLAKFAMNAAFNTAIATEHIALMAASLGLGTCWVHLFEKEKVAALFGLPPWIIPVTLMPVGFPDEDPEPRPRKSLEEITI